MIGNSIDALPRNRLTGCSICEELRLNLCFGKCFGMTILADLQEWECCALMILHRGVTIGAFKLVFGHMNFVAEWKRLLDRII